MKQTEHALVVGGGIAGCSAAIALAQAGARVTMLEKQRAWRFQSSGIFIYHNGLAALGSLGALPQILSSGFAIAGTHEIQKLSHPRFFGRLQGVDRPLPRSLHAVL